MKLIGTLTSIGALIPTSRGHMLDIVVTSFDSTYSSVNGVQVVPVEYALTLFDKQALEFNLPLNTPVLCEVRVRSRRYTDKNQVERMFNSMEARFCLPLPQVTAAAPSPMQPMAPSEYPYANPANTL